MITASARNTCLVIAGLLTAGLVLANQPAGKQPPEDAAQVKAVKQWLTANAVGIGGGELAEGFKELQPLQAAFKGVRVIGVGETRAATSHRSSRSGRGRCLPEANAKR
jgi:hypothetical protein